MLIAALYINIHFSDGYTQVVLFLYISCGEVGLRRVVLEVSDHGHMMPSVHALIIIIIIEQQNKTVMS